MTTQNKIKYESDKELVQAMAELWVHNKGDADGFWIMQEKIFDAVKEIERLVELAK